ncbi:fatty acyl-CoA reductase wat isoform X2 [Anabrus simplex]
MKETIVEKDEGVQSFYRDSTALVTGATGFIGMLLVEKLLRSCPEIKKIILLMRAKKGKTMEQRFEALMNDPVFSAMKQICPKYEEKLAVVSGDCALPNLGLSDDDRWLIQQEVNVVFHCAATVRFDEPLKTAAAINVRAIRDLLRIAQHMKNLRAFVHVSTAYSHCPRKEIGEVLYDSPMDYDKLLNLVDTLKENILDRITPEIIDPWPNTYAFTKAIGEEVVLQEGKGLPVCIVRPSMVITTNNEPYPGWANTINGPIGAAFGAAIGILHTVYLHVDEHADMVPADLVINNIIVAAWSEAHKRTEIIKSIRPPDSIHEKPDNNRDLTVYNYVSSPRNTLTWGKFVHLCENMDYPSEHCVWYYSLICTPYYWLNNFFRIFLHYLPALIVDLACLVIGRKPIMLKAFRKIHKFLDITAYFHESRWEFSDKNVQKLWSSLSTHDKNVFPFDIAEIDWKVTLHHVIPGLRVYLMKDPLNTVSRGTVKYRRLKILHYTVVSAFILLCLRVLWWLISAFI